MIFVAAAYAAQVETCDVKFEKLAKKAGIRLEKLIPGEEEEKAAKRVLEEVGKILGAPAVMSGKAKALAGELSLATFSAKDQQIEVIYKKSGEVIAYRSKGACKFLSDSRRNSIQIASGKQVSVDHLI